MKDSKQIVLDLKITLDLSISEGSDMNRNLKVHLIPATSCKPPAVATFHLSIEKDADETNSPNIDTTSTSKD